MVVLAYNPNTWETESERWGVQGQPLLHSETLFEENTTVF